MNAVRRRWLLLVLPVFAWLLLWMQMPHAFPEGDELFTGDATVLTLVNGGNSTLTKGRMRRAIEQLKMECPNVEVRIVDLPEEQLNAVLLAGDEGADIIVVAKSHEDNLIQAGVFLDLRQCEKLTEELEAIDHLLPMFEEADGLYGIPLLVRADVIMDRGVLKNYDDTGLALDDCSWQEFIQAALRFNGDFDGDSVNDMAFFREDIMEPCWIAQYMARFESVSQISFDTQIFRDLMSSYKEAVESKKIVDAFSGEFGPDQVIYRATEIDGPMVFAENEPHGLPTINGETVAIASPKALSINEKSHNIDLAIRLMELYLQPEIAYTDGNEDFLRKDHENFMDLTQFSEGQIEEINNQLILFENLKANPITAELREMFVPLLSRYYDGTLTLDQLVDELQYGLQMRIMG